MATLDLFKARQKHTVVIDVNGEATEFYVPMEYTVEEVERIYELQAEVERLAKKKISAKTKEQDLRDFWDAVFGQLLVLFNHYHPEITLEQLKKMLSKDDAAKIVVFFAKSRISGDEEEPSKKKVARKKSSERFDR
jgi:hypothetical protein